MTKRALVLLGALGVTGWLPWGMDGARAASIPRTEEVAHVSFRHDIAPILVTSCSMASCHGASLHPPEIDSDADVGSIRRALLAAASEERPDRKYVQPGDVRRSYLIDKVEGRLVDAECADHDCGARMPAKNPALSERKRALLAAWIAQGALDD